MSRSQPTKIFYTKIIPKAPCHKVHKRLERHLRLIDRVRQRHMTPKTVVKRRRPSKQLVTDLAALADALPRNESASKRALAVKGKGCTQVEGTSQTARLSPKKRSGSLQSRPGAGKRKEKLLRAERERFAKNLALMVAGSQKKDVEEDADREEGGASQRRERKHEPTGHPQQKDSLRARWAAIRAHVDRNMKKRDES